MTAMMSGYPTINMSIDSKCNDAATVASSTTVHAKLELVTAKYSRLQQRVESLQRPCHLTHA